jgi:poly(A) polymerase/tRNA nucleotidyltransferase (CCA-adding enzyme)
MRYKKPAIIKMCDIPDTVLNITEKLTKNGHKAFIVGGAIRDSLLGCPAKDWDIATNAMPERIYDLFSNMTRFHLKHGTVTLVYNKRLFEVTTFRGAGGFGSSIEEDLEHRDFTFNAMAYDISKKNIIDPFGGKQDMKNKIVRAVVNPLERFQEDPLRMMRAIRFSSELTYSIDLVTLRAISSMTESIDSVAKERIRDELLRILMLKKPSKGFNLMRKTGLLQRILPELLEGYRKQQNNYHRYTIYHHTMETVDSIEKGSVPRLCALFHDIAKPRVRKKIKGKWRFFNHAVASAELTKEIMLRLRFSNEEIFRVTGLIANHMFSYKQELSDKALRRLIKRVGEDTIDELIKLRKADDLAHGWGPDFENRIDKFKTRINDQIKKSYPFSVTDLAVTGHDVMNVLNLRPGPEVGKILNRLLEIVIEDPEYNERGKLIETLKFTGQGKSA